jgi:hypothetical protein
LGHAISKHSHYPPPRPLYAPPPPYPPHRHGRHCQH